MISEKVREYLIAEQQVWPVRSHHASQIGHPCPRYLYHLRKDWDKRPLPPEGLLEVFREGEDQERAVLRLLEDAGFKTTRSQTGYTWEEYQISGRIDGFIVPATHDPNWPAVNGDGKPKPVPFEVKTMAPWTFSKINSIEDMMNARQLYLRQYPAQMMVYLLMANEELGVFILKDKTAARIKDIWVRLDWEYADKILAKVAKVNEALEKGEPPERVEGDYCHDCPFLLICEPTITSPEGAAIIDDEELEQLLARREELSPLVKEYKEVEKRIGEILEGIERAVVGEWLVTGRWVERKEYTVPGGKYWRREIKRLVPAGEEV